MKLISNRMFWNIPKIFFHDIEMFQNHSEPLVY